MATILGIYLSLKINLCCLFSRNGTVKFSYLVLPDNREIKHDVYGQRQTGNDRLLLVIKA